MSYFVRLPLTSLASLVCLIGLAPVVMATTPASSPSVVDHFCYAELTDGSVINLESICGITNRRQAEQTNSGVIDLRRGNGRLLAETQQLQGSLQSARTQQERLALLRQFEDRLPYSDRVRELQVQEQNLRQRMRATTNESQRRALTRQIDATRQQMRQDSSHQAVRRARSEVFQQLNR